MTLPIIVLFLFMSLVSVSVSVSGAMDTVPMSNKHARNHDLADDSESSSSSSSSSTGPSGYIPPVFPSPFTIIHDVELSDLAGSIALDIHHPVVYWTNAYGRWSTLVHRTNISTGQELDAIDCSEDADRFPIIKQKVQAEIVRLDDAGKLHVLDQGNNVVIHLLTNGTWISATSVPTSDGIWSYNVSPDGETYFISQVTAPYIVAIDRLTGSMKFNLNAAGGSVGFRGSNNHIYVSVPKNPAVNEYSSNGTLISTTFIQLVNNSMSGLVVDSHNTVIFLSPPSRDPFINKICYLFTSSQLSCLDGGPKFKAVFGEYSGIAIQKDQVSFMVSGPPYETSHVITLAAIDHEDKQA